MHSYGKKDSGRIGPTDNSTQCHDTLRPERRKKKKTNPLEQPPKITDRSERMRELIFYQCISLEYEDTVGYYVHVLVCTPVQYRTQRRVKISFLTG